MKADEHWPGWVKVGDASPGAPVGDVYVSETLVAQVGEEAVRREVRALYSAAYRAAEERRRVRANRRPYL